jgi:hypothetical protein
LYVISGVLSNEKGESSSRLCSNANLKLMLMIRIRTFSRIINNAGTFEMTGALNRFLEFAPRISSLLELV